MCQCVTMDGQEIGQIQQLADRIGVAPLDLVWLPDAYSPEVETEIGFEQCLCPIDLEATADKFGYVCTRDDIGDAMFTRIVA